MSRKPATCKHGACPASRCRLCKAEYNKMYKNSKKGRAIVNAGMRRYMAGYIKKSWTDDPVRMRFRSILGNARRRKQCNLTPKDLMLLWEQQRHCCAYCGTEMTYERGGRKPSTISIDRINSSIPYTIDNVVLACWACNSGKNIMTPEEYVEHCRKVAQQHLDD